MPARILVVDDEPSIVDLLQYNLQRANYEVLVARDGQEALSKARVLIDNAKTAIAEKDVAKLNDAVETLKRTQKMFKGVLARS